MPEEALRTFRVTINRDGYFVKCLALSPLSGTTKLRWFVGDILFYDITAKNKTEAMKLMSEKYKIIKAFNLWGDDEGIRKLLITEKEDEEQLLTTPEYTLQGSITGRLSTNGNENHTALTLEALNYAIESVRSSQGSLPHARVTLDMGEIESSLLSNLILRSNIRRI